MIQVQRTTYTNPDFIKLVGLLNLYLADINGKKHDFFMQFNNIDVLVNVIVIYKDNLPVACGAIWTYTLVICTIGDDYGWHYRDMYYGGGSWQYTIEQANNTKSRIIKFLDNNF